MHEPARLTSPLTSQDISFDRTPLFAATSNGHLATNGAAIDRSSSSSLLTVSQLPFFDVLLYLGRRVVSQG